MLLAAGSRIDVLCLLLTGTASNSGIRLTLLVVVSFVLGVA